MNSKQRAHLMSLAQSLEPVVQIGKATLTDEVIESIEEALEKRELIKIHVLKNNADDKKEIAQMLSERTGSIVVQIIGNMIVLFKYQNDASKRKIEL